MISIRVTETIMQVLKVLSLLVILECVIPHDPNVGLRFGNNVRSYIMMAPDMSPLQEQLSICAWIKKIRPANRHGAWLYYSTSDIYSEILVYDSLLWVKLLDDNISHSTTPVQSEWYHFCYTFLYSTRTKSLYYNGKKIGTETTPSGRTLSLATGSLVIGQVHKTYKMEARFNPSHPFGGELAKLNLYSRTLTDQEVAEMYSSGICSNYEHSLTEDTFLSWDTLLGDETEKHGNIVKFNLTCPATTAQPTEQPEDNCPERWGFLSEFRDQVII